MSFERSDKLCDPIRIADIIRVLKRHKRCASRQYATIPGDSRTTLRLAHDAHTRVNAIHGSGSAVCRSIINNNYFERRGKVLLQ